MNLDDIRTVKERLQLEYNTNLEKINTLQSKISILKANTLDNKLLAALAISLFILSPIYLFSCYSVYKKNKHVIAYILQHLVSQNK